MNYGAMRYYIKYRIYFNRKFFGAFSFEFHPTYDTKNGGLPYINLFGDTMLKSLKDKAKSEVTDKGVNIQASDTIDIYLLSITDERDE